MANFSTLNQNVQSCPFSEETELVHDLEFGQNNTLVRRSTPAKGPPAVPGQPIVPLDDTLVKPLTIPGQPMIPLDEQSVTAFLQKELATKQLDDMFHILWLLSSKNNINPLHHQAIKGRQILITERPDLHLVWYYDRIFIKPIPRCLLNCAFFKTYISGNGSSEIQRATNGFLRTYARLITHESDFEVAKEKGLLPKDGALPDEQKITWTKWCRYIDGFQYFDENNITSRHIYGELRLTRLNFYSKVFFYQWNYFDTFTQYGLYFGRFMAPYLFVFGSITIVLTAMQTTLTADTLAGNTSYQVAARSFATFSICATGIGLLFFPLLYVFFQFRELMFAIIHGQRNPKVE